MPEYSYVMVKSKLVDYLINGIQTVILSTIFRFIIIKLNKNLEQKEEPCIFT